MPTNKSTKKSTGSKSKKDKGKVRVSKEDSKKLTKSGDSGSKSESRFSGVEKGEYASKESAYINSYLSVSRAKTAMNSYIRDVIDNKVTKKNKDGEETESHVTIQNAQFGYTVVAEYLMTKLIRDTKYLLKKDSKKADMYDINFDNLRRAIRNDRNYGYFIRALVEEYNPTANDYTNLFFDPKNFTKSLENKSFEGKENIQLDSSAKNFICYLVSTSMNEIIRQSVNFCICNKRQSINLNIFTASTLNLFLGQISGELSVLLDDLRSKFSTKIGEKKVKSKKDKKKVLDDSDDGSESESDNEEDKSGDGSDSDSDDGSDAGSDSGSDSDDDE